MEGYLSLFAQQGVLGITVIFLAWYVIKEQTMARGKVAEQQTRMETHLSRLAQDHKAERDEWRKEAKEMQVELIKVIKSNTQAVTELREMVKNVKT